MKTSIDSGQGGIDPIKIQVIRECLEKEFVGVTFSEKIRPTFTFKNGVRKLSWLLVMNQEFLVDCTSLEELRNFIENKVIPKVFKNPGKRIQVSKYRDITVEEKNPS